MRYLDSDLTTNDELIDIYNRIISWYEIRHVHFMIGKKSYRREFAILSENGMMRRPLRVHNDKNFTFIFLKWNILNKFSRKKGLDKFYHSASIYNSGVPFQNYDLSVNVESKIWSREHHKDMCGYDLFIDIDADDHTKFNRAKESMILIHEFFMNINLPHQINFSGKGFHVIVPYKFLPQNLSFDPEDKNSIYDYCLNRGKYLYDNFSEMVDTCVYDSKRLIKCPYTLVLYGKDLYVCTPIKTEKEIYDCKLDDFKPENVDIHSFNIHGDYLFYDINKEVKLWQE